MQKPRLSFWQIFNMSFGFMGIQFGWGLQLANMSGIYTYLGRRYPRQHRALLHARFVRALDGSRTTVDP